MDNKNEMEEIQRGLESFLEKELDVRETPGGGQKRSGRRPQSPQGTERYGYDSSRGENPSRRKAYSEEEEIQVIGYPREEEPRQRRRPFSEEELYQEQRYEEEVVDWDSEYYEEEEPRQRGREEQPPGRRYYGGKPYQERRVEEESAARRRYEEEPYRRRYEEEQSSRRRRYEEEEPSRRSMSPQKRSPSTKKGRASREEEDQMPKKSRKKKQRRKKHGLRNFLIAAILVIALLGVGLYQLVGVVYGKMTYSEIASESSLPMKEDGVVNILLIGNDSRENSDDGRSDAMILLSVSSRTKTVYMTSLLRDIYVEIPGHNSNRLNAAYSYGGAELLMETIEKNFDIPVNRYMLVNFEAFANMVDAVGGIELELTSEEIEYVNGYLVEYNMLTGREQGTDNMDTSVSGLVHLNGPQALAYTRNRYLGTDFGRTERQRKVLTAVIKKMPSAMLTNSGELMDGLLPNLTTNLTRGECFQLSLMAGKMITYDIVSDSIPQPGTYGNATIREMAVLEIDFDANIKYLKEKIYGE